MPLAEKALTTEGTEEEEVAARHGPEKSGIMEQGVSPPNSHRLLRPRSWACAPEGVASDFTIHARRDGPRLERGGKIPALARSGAGCDRDAGRARRGAGCRGPYDPREGARRRPRRSPHC